MSRPVFCKVVAGTAVACALWLASEAVAGSVAIAPSKDNTLYQSATGSLSNGAGHHLFSGRTSFNTNAVRRAVLAFDVAGNVPAGATIESVTLTLNMSKAPLGATAQTFTLHRLLADWGEAGSDAPLQEGGGAPAQVGDATWLHRFFNDRFWASQGGDFNATPSASRSVTATPGFFTWGPTSEMRADVQGWLDSPGTNFGWLLLGNEGQLQTSRRFDSRENLTVSVRPVLTVEFTATSSGAGRIDDASLTVQRTVGGQLQLDWGASCVLADSDYAVYEGTLGAFYSHEQRLCSTGGATTATFAPPAGGAYYIVVPRNDTREGSYGKDSDGIERPGATAPCLTQETAACP